MKCTPYKNNFKKSKITFNFLISSSITLFLSKEYASLSINKEEEKCDVHCKYIKECGNRINRIYSVMGKNSEEIKKAKSIYFNYCFTDKYKECQRYKIIENNNYLPNDLMPDGTIIKFRNLLKNYEYSY